MKSEYEKEIEVFVSAMRYKLNKNRHKGKWESYTLEQGLELLKAEVGELEAAIREGSPIDVIMEAADVANFALILATGRIRSLGVSMAGADAPPAAPKELQPEDFGYHGWWIEGNTRVSHMWKHLPSGDMYYEDLPVVRQRKLKVFPFDNTRWLNYMESLREKDEKTRRFMTSAGEEPHA